MAVIDPDAPEEQALLAFRKRQPEDFEISWFSGTGPGGQNRNKVQASARLTHRPTGLVRTAQTRSRENSERLAHEALLADLDAELERRQAGLTNRTRQNQIGSGERGDKRRTYRFQDDRVHDHQTGRTARCSEVMKGGFDRLWPAASRPKNLEA